MPPSTWTAISVDAVGEALRTRFAPRLRPLPMETAMAIARDPRRLYKLLGAESREKLEFALLLTLYFRKETPGGWIEKDHFSTRDFAFRMAGDSLLCRRLQ